jgi:uncharacterized protein YndB with AHSA1/START domain
MRNDLVVTRSILLNADVSRVWDIITHPEFANLYMFNCKMQSDWREGSPVTWTGIYENTPVKFTGVVLEVIPMQTLRFTAFDPHGGNEGYPENYIHVAYRLIQKRAGCELQVMLSNFDSDEMRAQIAAEEWDFNILPQIKSVAETPIYAP